MILAEETCDEFVERVFKHFPESKEANNKAHNFALTAKGLAVYLAGPHRLYDVEYAFQLYRPQIEDRSYSEFLKMFFKFWSFRNSFFQLLEFFESTF